MVGAHPGLVTRAPDVIEFLSKWHLNGETQVATESWMPINDASWVDKASYFLVNLEVDTQLQPLEPPSSMVAT